jgi:hypothetical protein
MKRLMVTIEIISSLLGMLLLFGPKAWDGAGRGVTLFLFIAIIFAGGFGGILVICIVRAQRQPPYID